MTERKGRSVDYTIVDDPVTMEQLRATVSRLEQRVKFESNRGDAYEAHIYQDSDDISKLNETIKRLEGDIADTRPEEIINICTKLRKAESELEAARHDLSVSTQYEEKLRSRLTVLERVNKQLVDACENVNYSELSGCKEETDPWGTRAAVKESLAAARGKEEGER